MDTRHANTNRTRTIGERGVVSLFNTSRIWYESTGAGVAKSSGTSSSLSARKSSGLDLQYFGLRSRPFSCGPEPMLTT